MRCYALPLVKRGNHITFFPTLYPKAFKDFPKQSQEAGPTFSLVTSTSVGIHEWRKIRKGSLLSK